VALKCKLKKYLKIQTVFDLIKQYLLLQLFDDASGTFYTNILCLVMEYVNEIFLNDIAKLLN